MNHSSPLDRAAVALLILLTAVVILLPYSPAVMPVPQRDSGIFLYTGWRVLQGDLPYRDAWDHKPPGIYYLDALGLASGSIWGVWLLEVASLFAAGMLCFSLVRLAFGLLAAVFSLGLLVIGLFPILQGGNLTTEYALPLQFACLWLARYANRDDFRSLRGFVIGVLTGLLFFIRPNTIGVCLAILAFLTVLRLRARQKRRWAGELLALSSGGLGVAILILGYFAAQGALGELWDAAFLYNAIYSAVNLRQRLISLVIGFGGLAPGGLLSLAFFGYGIALAGQVYRPLDIPSNGRTLMMILLIDLPLEIVLVNLPGHAHPHYWIALLPALAWFSGFAFWLFLSQLERSSISGTVQSVFTFGALGLLVWASAGNSILVWRTLRQGSNDRLATYLAMNTTPQDSILVWGEEGGINFEARRRSPTQYFYLTPLFTQGYTDEQRVLEFLDGLLKSPPAVILDALNDDFPVFDLPVRSARIDQRINQLRQRYQVVDDVDNWQVYR